MLSYDELSEIKKNIKVGLGPYQKDPETNIMIQNLPNKNHNRVGSTFRGSRYRGPSKNRNKWQVMKMVKKETVRIGAIKTEEEAARIYDILAILTEGLQVSNHIS